MVGKTGKVFQNRFVRISCIGILAGVIASCNSAPNSPSTPVSTDASPEEQDTVTALKDKPEKESPDPEVAPQESAQDNAPALPKAEPEAVPPDSEVEALREEALEVAIYEGNINPLTTNCRMGQCVESYYTFTILMRQVGSELLYSTELVTFSVDMEGTEPGRWGFQPSETLVLCSTQRPLVIYQDGDEYLLDHINPGEYPPGFALESHGLYWAICHDVDNVFDELTDEDMAGQAAGLGYGPELEAEQTRTDFLELFES